jgi:hypothetical protein
VIETFNSKSYQLLINNFIEKKEKTNRDALVKRIDYSRS